MKKFILAIAAVSLSVPVFALSIDPGMRIKDHYREVIREIPETHRQCSTRSVPQQTNSFSAGKAVIGGIIGGVIGHNLGGTANRHVTASFGTLAGSVLGGTERKTTHRRQRHCEDVTHYSQERETVYSHSTVTFREDGKTYTVEFQK